MAGPAVGALGTLTGSSRQTVSGVVLPTGPENEKDQTDTALETLLAEHGPGRLESAALVWTGPREGPGCCPSGHCFSVPCGRS